jgi:hypothetical protein
MGINLYKTLIDFVSASAAHSQIGKMSFNYYTNYFASYAKINDVHLQSCIINKEIKRNYKATSFITHSMIFKSQQPPHPQSVMVRTNQPKATGGTDGVGDYFIKSDDSTWWAGISPNNTFINSDTFYTLVLCVI